MKSGEMHSRKAQAGIEYLIVFTIAIAMTLPLIVMFVIQTNNVKADITSAEIQKASSKIIDYAQEVHYMGAPAQKTLIVHFPDNINSIDITQNKITFNITTSDLNYLIIEETSMNLSGSIRTFEGNHYLTFKAVNNSVLITDK